MATGSDGHTIANSDKNKFISDDDTLSVIKVVDSENGNTVDLVRSLQRTADDYSVDYSEDTIDVSKLGIFSFNFYDTDYGDFASSSITSEKVYSISAVTGQGEIDGSKLKVTNVGTFTVTVTTELCNTAPQTTQTATLIVTPKDVYIDGLTGVERRPVAGDTEVELENGVIHGIINEDNVEIDYKLAYGLISDTDSYNSFANEGTDSTEEFAIDIYDVVLTGSKAANYNLTSYNDTSTVFINQAVPYISWPDAMDVIIGTETSDDQLLGGKVMVEDGGDWTEVTGSFVFDTYSENLNAGTYAQTVKFIADNNNSSVSATALTAIADASRTVSQIVEPAQVKFTVDSKGDISAEVLNSNIEITEDDYVITESTWGSDPDVTLVAATFVDNNFRHAGTFESTGKQVAAYGSEDTYTVTFTNFDDLTITKADPEDIHILPSDEDNTVIAWKTTWADVTTSYDVGSRFPQPTHDVTFYPVYGEETDISGTASGTDFDGTTKNLSNIGVTLTQGSEIIATTTTDSSGYYEFSDVYEGKYNIVFTRDYISKTEVTYFIDTDSTKTCNVTLPNYSGNSVLYITEGMTAITVSDLNTAVSSKSSQLSITSVDTTVANEMIEKADTISSNLKLFYDIQFTYQSDGETVTTSDITYYIPLAGIYQGKENYKVYYMDNDGNVFEITDSTTAFVNSAKDLVTLKTANSGVYGIYFESVAATPFEATKNLEVVYTSSPISIDGMFDLENKGVNPTYTISSADGGVATIDALTGEVTVTRIGTFTITVTTEATDDEKAYTSSATLKVTAKDVSLANISAISQASIDNDTEFTVTLNDTATVVGLEHGDVVHVNLTTGAEATIDNKTYWEDTVLTTEGSNTFAVSVSNLVLTGDDAYNYNLVSDTFDTTVEIYKDIPYFAWPTAKDVVYGTVRTDDDLYGGKVMVKNPEGGWTLLEGSFEWVDENITAETEAGDHSYEVRFVETNPDTSSTYYNELVNTTQKITQTVQKAQVQFTVGEYGYVTAEDIDNTEDLKEADFTVTYINQDTSENIVSHIAPTDTGIYYVYAYFVQDASDETNYRHAGTMESTGKQIGSFYCDISADVYTTTFMVDGDEYKTIEGSLGDIHILPTLGDEYESWTNVDSGASFAFGSRYPQTTNNVTFTATKASEENATITGTVTGTDLDGTPNANLANIAVTLVQGSEIIDFMDTDENGNFSFTVDSGKYNLVVNRDQAGNLNEMTVYIEAIADETVTRDFYIPDVLQNAILNIDGGVSAITVQNLTALVEESDNDNIITLSITPDDNFLVDGENDDYNAIVTKREDNKLDEDDLKLFINIDLTQTTNQGTKILTELEGDTLLAFHIPLDGIYQGFNTYEVYRYHDGEVDIITTKANSDGEYIVVAADTSYITLYARNFCLYGIACYDTSGSNSNNNNNSSSSNSSTTTTETTTELNRVDHNAYMNGYPDDTFKATNNITRAETVVMFSRLIMEQMEPSETYENTFTDVTTANWYYNYIGYMEQFGIITGYSDGTFKGDSYITRAEFAAIACRFDNLTSDADCPFTDVDESHWAASSITAAAEKGWITGYNDGTFAPDKYITRAEAVTLVNRMLERYCDEDYVDNNPDEIVDFTDLDSTYWAYYQIMEACHTHDYTKDDDSETWTEIIWHAQMTE